MDRGLKWLVLLELLIPAALLTLGIYHGLMQVLYRAGWIRASEFWGLEYYQGLTLHGVVNALVFTTFFAVAFGNILVPYLLKMRYNMKVAWFSFALMLTGTLFASWAILARKASVLYTFYPPLKAHPLFYIGLALVVIGSWVAFFNWIPVYLRWRRENPDKKTPIGIVGLFVQFIVWTIASVAVAYEIVFMLIPWSMGWVETVNAELARTLFWMFGHPLVYFWLLGAYIMYYAMLPKVAGGKLYSDFAARLVFMLFILFSMPVGVHHQFTDPSIGHNWKLLHTFFTYLVFIPSFLTAFTLAASLEYAGRKNGGNGLFGWWLKLPWFSSEGNKWLFSYFIAGLLIFIFGGISGLVQASYSVNLLVHNTSWVPGHFHMTVAGPVFLAFTGMMLYLVHKLTGREIPFKRWTVVVPYMWLVGIALFSWGLMRGGLHGEPRRTNLGLSYLNPDSPLYMPDWQLYTAVTAIGGIIMFTAMLIYFAQLFGIFFTKKTGDGTIEFPIAEPYHDENVPWVQNFKPWIIVLLILVAIAYTPVIMDVLQSTFGGSPPYSPENPLPLR